MRFLINMNIPRDLVTLLKAYNHLSRHVGDIGMARAEDSAIVEEAKKNKEIIITHDLDYGHLLAFSGKSAPSVIILRIRNMRVEYILERILEALSKIEKALIEGAVVVIEDVSIRVRYLPIIKSK